MGEAVMQRRRGVAATVLALLLLAQAVGPLSVLAIAPPTIQWDPNPSSLFLWVGQPLTLGFRACSTTQCPRRAAGDPAGDKPDHSPRAPDTPTAAPSAAPGGAQGGTTAPADPSLVDGQAGGRQPITHGAAVDIQLDDKKDDEWSIHLVIKPPRHNHDGHDVDTAGAAPHKDSAPAAAAGAAAVAAIGGTVDARAHPAAGAHPNGRDAAAAIAIAAAASAAYAAGAVPPSPLQQQQQPEGPTGEPRSHVAALPGCAYCLCTSSDPSCTVSYTGYTGGMSVYAPDSRVQLSARPFPRTATAGAGLGQGQPEHEGLRGTERDEDRRTGTTLSVTLTGGDAGFKTVYAKADTATSTSISAQGFSGPTLPVSWIVANWALQLTADAPGPNIPVDTPITFTAILINTFDDGRPAQPVTNSDRVITFYREDGTETQLGPALPIDGQGQATLAYAFPATGQLSVIARVRTYTNYILTSNALSLELVPSSRSISISVLPTVGATGGDTLAFTATVLDQGIPVSGAPVTIFNRRLAGSQRVTRAAASSSPWDVVNVAADHANNNDDNNDANNDGDDNEEDKGGATAGASLSGRHASYAAAASVRSGSGTWGGMPNRGAAAPRGGDERLGGGNTQNDGRFTLQVTVQRGTYDVYASTVDTNGGTVTSNPAADAVAVVSGPAPARVVLAPLEAVCHVGVPVKLTVNVTDALAQPVRGAAVKFAMTGDCQPAFVGDCMPTTDDAGVATVQLSCLRSGRLTAVASVGAVESEASRLEFLGRNQFKVGDYPSPEDNEYQHTDRLHHTSGPRYAGGGGGHGGGYSGGSDSSGARGRGHSNRRGRLEGDADGFGRHAEHAAPA